jgi:PBP1b-binding outer membrane lipoprotein LpoB
MKIVIFLCVSILILSSCGKKTKPEYQVKINQIQVIL